ncbi:hypothetical protein ACIO52_02705 [Nocardia sp. NPDC087230]|uniref:hypothetical protein n=1 Tax=Nocardia sp. NPDC087230 TaxID=3364331 RepID=UPI003808282F
MTRPPQPARILRSLPTSRLPGGIAHATVAGVAFSPTATALAYLSFPASDRTTARDVRMRTAVVAWELFVHHGFRDGVHRQFVTGLNQVRRRARTLAAFDPLPHLRRYEQTRAVAALTTRWARRHSRRPTALALLDLAVDVHGARRELVGLLAHYGLRPRQLSTIGTDRLVLVEAIAAAALGARHLNLATWMVLDIDALLDPTDPSRATLPQPIRRAPPRSTMPRLARPSSL